MSLNSPFSSFSFFLSFSLAWVKVSEPPDWGVLQCLFNNFNYWWNRTFKVFLNTYNFPIFKIWKRKMVWTVLLFNGFSIFRFYLFLRGSYLFPELAEISILFQRWICPNWRFYSFYGWAISFRSCLQHFVSTPDLSKLKILLQFFLTRAGLFGAKILLTNHSTFPLPPPRRMIDLDFFHFNWLKCKGYR